MLTSEIAHVLLRLDAVDLDAAGVPRPHFLRRVARMKDGRKIVGEVVFPSSYEPITARRKRVNAAECLHAAWNAAHLIAGEIGGGELRATKITVVPGNRPVRADTPLIIVAELPNLRLSDRDGRGEFTAEILDRTGRILQTITAEFWARRCPQAPG